MADEQKATRDPGDDGYWTPDELRDMDGEEILNIFFDAIGMPNAGVEDDDTTEPGAGTVYLIRVGRDEFDEAVERYLGTPRHDAVHPPREPTPMCDDDTHYWLQGVNPPPDGAQCQCGARSWPVEDSALLRGMVQQARLNHPLPWRVEDDWGVSVESASGRVFFGTDEECHRIVALAEQQLKDADAFGKEFEAIMQSDADSARTPQRNPADG